jgi:hypothetical protein
MTSRKIPVAISGIEVAVKVETAITRSRTRPSFSAEMIPRTTASGMITMKAIAARMSVLPSRGRTASSTGSSVNVETPKSSVTAFFRNSP